MNFQNKKYTLLPLLYKKKLLTNKLNISQIFNLMLNLREKQSEIILSVTYNNTLRKNIIENIINNFLKMNNFIIKNYYKNID